MAIADLCLGHPRSAVKMFGHTEPSHKRERESVCVSE